MKAIGLCEITNLEVGIIRTEFLDLWINVLMVEEELAKVT